MLLLQVCMANVISVLRCSISMGLSYEQDDITDRVSAVGFVMFAAVICHCLFVYLFSSAVFEMLCLLWHCNSSAVVLVLSSGLLTMTSC